MKTKTLILILVLIAALAFSQTVYRQDKNQVLFSHPQIPWTVQEAGAAAAEPYFLAIKRTSTASSSTYWSQAYFVVPFMYIQSDILDTGAADSIRCRVELWESLYADTSTFMRVKTLTWHDEWGAKAGVEEIDAEGNWWCDVGDNGFPGLRYFMLRVVPLAGHRVIGTTVKQRFSVLGHSL